MLNPFLKSSSDLGFITVYYDLFNTKPDGKNPPLVLPKESMDNFIKLTSIDDEHITK